MVNTKHGHHNFAFYSYVHQLISPGKTLCVFPIVRCDFFCSSFFALTSILFLIIFTGLTFAGFCLSMYSWPTLFWFFKITIYYSLSHLFLYYTRHVSQQGLSILCIPCFRYTILKTYLFAFLYTCLSRFVSRI